MGSSSGHTASDRRVAVGPHRRQSGKDRPNDLSAVSAWLHRGDELRADRVIALPGGLACLSDEFPAAHDLNLLTITDAVASDELGASAESVFGSEGLGHRLIVFRTPVVPEAHEADLVARGYQRQTEAIMVHSGVALARSPEEVEALSLQERADVAEQSWRDELPAESPEVWRQLGERIRTVSRIGTATFFATRDVRGAVVARADLYERDGFAQIENVFTTPGARGHGAASAVVSAAVDRAQTEGVTTLFLVADADDWPRAWYRRLGFVDAGIMTSWHRGH